MRRGRGRRASWRRCATRREARSSEELLGHARRLARAGSAEIDRSARITSRAGLSGYQRSRGPDDARSQDPRRPSSSRARPRYLESIRFSRGHPRSGQFGSRMGGSRSQPGGSIGVSGGSRLGEKRGQSPGVLWAQPAST
eukprot:492545-Pyramimonas_sp.AAC.1